MDMRDLVPWMRPRAPARADMDPFASLQREMNRLFDDAFRGWGGMPTPLAPATAWPTLAVTEDETAYTVTAEVPGLEEKDVELSLTDDCLVMKGEKKSETKDDEKHISEHFYGRFERRLPLGADIDREKVTASFDKGVLTVTLPKMEAAAAPMTRIPISKAA